jgi:hypothetical protein
MVAKILGYGALRLTGGIMFPSSLPDGEAPIPYTIINVTLCNINIRTPEAGDTLRLIYTAFYKAYRKVILSQKQRGEHSKTVCGQRGESERVPEMEKIASLAGLIRNLQ